MKKNSVKKQQEWSGKGGALALLYGALNIADFMTTKRILNTGGEEYNPIVNFLIRKKCFGIFKTVTTLTGMAVILGEEKPRTLTKALLSLYGVLVTHNMKEIVQFERKRRPEIKGDV